MRIKLDGRSSKYKTKAKYASLSSKTIPNFGTCFAVTFRQEVIRYKSRKMVSPVAVLCLPIRLI